MTLVVEYNQVAPAPGEILRQVRDGLGYRVISVDWHDVSNHRCGLVVEKIFG